MTTVDQIVEARRALATETTYGEICDRTGLSSKALFCLQHFGVGLSPTAAARRCRSAEMLPTAKAVDTYCRGLRQWRRWNRKGARS